MASGETGDFGTRLTVGIEGSFGVLHYALLAFAATSSGFLLTADLLERGFRPAFNADVEDIALKAQPADGSIHCRASTDGLISLIVDDTPLWSRQFGPADADTSLWVEAAQTGDVTLISGDHLQISANGIASALAAIGGSLVMARIPTIWTYH